MIGRMTNLATLSLQATGSLTLRSGSFLDNGSGTIVLNATCTAEPNVDGVGIPPACLAD